MRGWGRSWCAVAVLVVAVGLVSGRSAGPVAAESTGRFVPVLPTRLLDTRDGTGGVVGPVAAGQTVRLTVAGALVPSTATAVALNLTITQSSGPGFLAAFPAGSARPSTSNVNVVRANQTVANLAIVPVANGAVDLFMASAGHVLADVSGYWEPSGPTAPGRYIAIDPGRALDTRRTGRVSAGGVVDVQFDGVPAGATAVAVNITSVLADAPGFVTAWPTGQPRPVASNVNVAGADVVPNAALVPLGAGGRISLFTSAGTDLLVDLQGYVTGESTPVSGDGLFVPVAPFRVADSRVGGGLARLGAMFDQQLQIGGTGAVPASGVSAVAVNMTITDPWSPGFLSVYPGRSARPVVSNLNYQPDATVAGFALPRLGAGGTLNVVSRSQAEAIVDVSGYFTGEPAAPTAPPPVLCSDLMGYMYAPGGLANLDTAQVRMRDLSGARADWALDSNVFLHKIAPGCQYALLAKPSPTNPDALAMYRIDTLTEPSEPVLVSDVWGWRGAAFTPDARWVYLWGGDDPDTRTSIVVAVDMRTGAERYATEASGLASIVGVMATGKPVVSTRDTSSPVGGLLSWCHFGVQIEWVPCGNVITGGLFGQFSDIGGLVAVLADGPASYRNAVTASEYPIAPSGAYWGRLTWSDQPVVSVDGAGVRLFSVTELRDAYFARVPPTGTVLLDGVTSDFPEFSRPLRPSPQPPVVTATCAFRGPGC